MVAPEICDGSRRYGGSWTYGEFGDAAALGHVVAYLDVVAHEDVPVVALPPVVTPVRARGSSTTPITSSPSPSVPIRPPSPNGSQQLLRSTAQFLGVDLVRVTTVYIVGQLTAKSTKSAK